MPTREQIPLNWACAKSDLGTALTRLADAEGGTSHHLGQAIEAFHDALKERTRDRVPLEWAETHCNLGNALTTLGERERNTAHLKGAVAAHRAALEEYSLRVPPTLS